MRRKSLRKLSTVTVKATSCLEARATSSSLLSRMGRTTKIEIETLISGMG